MVHHVPDSHLNAYIRMKLAATEDDPPVRTYDESRWAELPEVQSKEAFLAWYQKTHQTTMRFMGIAQQGTGWYGLTPDAALDFMDRNGIVVEGGADITLERLAEFQEKAQKIKGKIKAAMFYPCAVMTVAMGILALLVLYVIPKFKAVFEGLMNGYPMPAFSMFVFNLSEAVKSHLIVAVSMLATVAVQAEPPERST